MFNKKIKKIIKVDGMNCEHCANKVEQALKNLESVKKVKVDLVKKEVVIFSDKKIDLAKVKTTIENLDYKYIGIVEE